LKQEPKSSYLRTDTRDPGGEEVYLALADIDRAAVINAIEEFDRRGRDAFLQSQYPNNLKNY
jgi:hypothetical protein